MPDRVDALVRDIESIPDLLDHLASGAWLHDALDWLPPARRIAMTGLGSSRFAAMHVEDAMRLAGIDASITPASAPPPPDAGTLLIAISSSGRTAEAVSAAEAHRGTGPVLAITRDAASPLALAADRVALLPVVAESSGVATTTFVATVATLLHLAPAICVDWHRVSPPADAILSAAASATRDILDGRAGWLPPVVDGLVGAEEIAVLAPWAERGVAEQAALLLRECPRRTAVAWDTAEWLHTGIYTALPGTAALLFAGSPSDEAVTRVIEGRGGRVVVVPEAPDGPEATAAPAAVAVVAPEPHARRLASSATAALIAAELWRRIAAAP